MQVEDDLIQTPQDVEELAKILGPLLTLDAIRIRRGQALKP